MYDDEKVSELNYADEMGPNHLGGNIMSLLLICLYYDLSTYSNSPEAYTTSRLKYEHK